MNAQTELESIATDWDAEIRDISLPAKEFHINKMWNISQLHPENLHIVSENTPYKDGVILGNNFIFQRYDKFLKNKVGFSVVDQSGKVVSSYGVKGICAFNLHVKSPRCYITTERHPFFALKLAEMGQPIINLPHKKAASSWPDLFLIDGDSVFDDYDLELDSRKLRKKLNDAIQKLELAVQNEVGEAEPFIQWAHLKPNGRPAETIENLDAILKAYGIVCRYNVIKKKGEFLIPNLTTSIDNREVAVTATIKSLCHQNNLPTSNINEFLSTIADKRPFNPVLNWIHSKTWDGKNRLHDFLKTVGVDNPSTLKNGELFHEHLIKKWMIQAISAACYPKISAAGVLVFQGKQGLGKTSWFKHLVPREFDGELIKADSSIDPQDKDSVFQNISYWLVELGELNATFNKSDVAVLKKFISSDLDLIRKPYAAAASEFGRKTVFFASVNNTGFLVDETGNRRYWTIPTTRIQYIHNFDMQQVWAEVYELLNAGESFRLDQEANDLLNALNEEHTSTDPIEEKLQSELDWDCKNKTFWSWSTATDIYISLFGVPPKRAEATRLSHYLKERDLEFKNSGGKKF
ncbi:hypothetical protein HUN24_17535 [Acinetobacter baumannii]|uniref:VapE domain-containing protein n=2 Tax=Moraxellaceae TaxID=468 RepID=UPI0015810C08|nr:VapE domain-containing protein [Acinetobacter baumannii]NUF20884.1 hypothetical protein [Acinetobacter baumannii]